MEAAANPFLYWWREYQRAIARCDQLVSEIEWVDAIVPIEGADWLAHQYFKGLEIRSRALELAGRILVPRDLVRCKEDAIAAVRSLEVVRETLIQRKVMAGAFTPETEVADVPLPSIVSEWTNQHRLRDLERQARER